MGVSAAVASGELSELQSKLQRVQTAIAQRTTYDLTKALLISVLFRLQLRSTRGNAAEAID